MAEVFSKQKLQSLSSTDLSRKGSIDEPIVDLITFINSQDSYFTTSSCSGRIAIVAQQSDVHKKGCKWLFMSHKKTELSDVMGSLTDDAIAGGSAVFKFEPFVLHVQCREIEDARKMHAAAVSSGFRNSGITLGKSGKVMMAVRSTHGLEAPLSNCGKMLVSEEYVDYLVELANNKLEENFGRIQRFFTNFKMTLEEQKDLKKPKNKNSYKGTADACMDKMVLDNGDSVQVDFSMDCVNADTDAGGFSDLFEEPP